MKETLTLILALSDLNGSKTIVASLDRKGGMCSSDLTTKTSQTLKLILGN